MGNSWFIPEAALRHDRVVILDVPTDCPKCHAGLAARRYARDIVGCMICGWELLARRPAREASRRGRGRGRGSPLP